MRTRTLFLAFLPLLAASCAQGVLAPEEPLLPESPGVPQEVVAEPVEDDGSMLCFRWREVPGATGYSWSLSDEDGDIVDCGKTALTSVRVEGLVGGFSYGFAVKSCNDNGGESEWSPRISGSTALPLDENDFYSMWYNGRDIMVGGRVVNRAEFPRAQVRKMSEISWDFLSRPFDDEEAGGILFIDNSATAYKATAAARKIGRDRIIIGRWRNANQPVFKINGNGAFLWTLEGSVMLRNVTLTAFQTTRPLLAGVSGDPHGEADWRFEDCTLAGTCASYGIFTEFDASCAVPGSMRFDNCILRANASFFACSDRKTTVEPENPTSAWFEAVQNLKSLTFNDCVFAPATLAEGQTDVWSDGVTRLAKRGALVALYHPNYRFDQLDISLSRCTSVDIGPGSGTQGLIDATTFRSLSVSGCIFWHSATIRNMYLANVLQNCPADASVSISDTWSNKVGDYIMAYGPKSKFTGNGGSCNAKISAQDILLGDCRPAENRFPKSAELPAEVGASYETKYWTSPESSTPDSPSSELPDGSTENAEQQ